jgi:hypothetical protein
VETLTQGKKLGPGDLSILVRDSRGAMIDPAIITYSIFQLTDRVPTFGERAYEYDMEQPNHMGRAPDDMANMTLVTPPMQVPARSSPGAYFVPISIPTIWHGVYRLVWYLSQRPDEPQNKVYNDFIVQPIDPISSSFEAPSAIIAPRPVTKNKFAPAIMYVRELLSDTNPDRNYHFRPPTPGKVVAGYTSRVGYIWLDSTILRMFDIAIAKLNWYNPKNITNYTIDNIPGDWGKIAAMEVAALCLSAEGARWAADEFSYSLNGVSLDINKAQLYMSLAQSYREQFSELAGMVTAIRPYSAGLRQQRWLLG